MTKQEARKIALANIKQMTAEQREWASGAIADALSCLDEYTRSYKVFVYLGTDTEPDTQEVVGLALMLEKVVSVPKVYGDQMKAVIISPYTNFKVNKWGILEPVRCPSTDDVNVAIIPLVAFDGLNRVGHGKGYYDKWLSAHDCIKIGLAFDCQEVSGLQIEDCDVPLDILVTQSRIIDCDGVRENIFGEKQ